MAYFPTNKSNDIDNRNSFRTRKLVNEKKLECFDLGYKKTFLVTSPRETRTDEIHSECLDHHKETNLLGEQSF